jgi:DNA-directed RNA polymerase subunit RPC12/RpoP
MKTIYHCIDCGVICECEKDDKAPPEGWERIEHLDGTFSWACPECKGRYK